MIKLVAIYALLVLCSLMSGCSVGPNYVPPISSVPAAWNEQGQNIQPVSLHGWWRDFHDPVLNNLIEQQALFNLSIKIAQARVKTARAEYALAFAQLFPMLNANAQPPTGTGVDLTQLLTLNAALEPDLFGKQRENRHRTEANLEVERAEREFARLNLQAEIASTYLALRESQTKTSILNLNIRNNRQMLHFLKSRYKAGLTNYINLAQQTALIETQLAELEQNKAVVTMLLHKIEILTGNNPGALAKQLLPVKPVPEITRSIHLGVPAELLRRRPDIISAERRVASIHANVRIAMANLFPHVTLGWLMAWQTQSIASGIFAMSHPESSFFGLFSAPVLNLNLYRIIDVRKREEAVAVLLYHLTVMRALHEVETQYSFHEHYKLSANHLKKSVVEKRIVLELAKNSYQKGASNFETVLRSEEDLNRLEMAHLHNIVIYQEAKINLYKALGGGIYQDCKPMVVDAKTLK